MRQEITCRLLLCATFRDFVVQGGQGYAKFFCFLLAP
jgi:hypothetical protein